MRATRTRQDVPSWLGHPVPLSAREVAHWEDYQFDRQTLGRRHSSSVLAWLYRGFARAFASSAPTAIPFARCVPGFEMMAFDAETRRFDLLAAHFGNCYRGSAVANYLLGVLAVLFALFGAAVIAPSEVGLRVASGAFEVVVLGAILAVHLKGRGHDAGVNDASPGGARWWGERWHSRWLDYRGLAERFRYASLRGLRGGGGSIAEPGADEASGEDWCTRYFRDHLRQAPWRPEPEAAYAANLLAAIDEQQRYHHGNSQQCHRLSHRLHRVTVWAFGLAFIVTVIEVLLHLDLPAHFGWPGPSTHDGPVHWHSNLWILATAGLPTFAAAVHGIQNACEYAKLARSSHDMYEALTKLRLEAQALLERDPAVASGESRSELRAQVDRFLHLSTDEATGWRAALWDKNVPLP